MTTQATLKKPKGKLEDELQARPDARPDARPQNKIKRSFTITPESAQFLREARKEIHAGSDSEALDLLLRELMLKRKLRALDAAYTDYYDSISEAQSCEEQEWATMAGPGLVAGLES
jgi:hypothetical protein